MDEIYKLIKFHTLGCCLHNSYFFCIDKLGTCFFVCQLSEFLSIPRISKEFLVYSLFLLSELEKK